MSHLDLNMTSNSSIYVVSGPFPILDGLSVNPSLAYLVHKRDLTAGHQNLE